MGIRQYAQQEKEIGTLIQTFWVSIQAELARGGKKVSLERSDKRAISIEFLTGAIWFLTVSAPGDFDCIYSSVTFSVPLDSRAVRIINVSSPGLTDVSWLNSAVIPPLPYPGIDSERQYLKMLIERGVLISPEAAGDESSPVRWELEGSLYTIDFFDSSFQVGRVLYEVASGQMAFTTFNKHSVGVLISALEKNLSSDNKSDKATPVATDDPREPTLLCLQTGKLRDEWVQWYSAVADVTLARAVVVGLYRLEKLVENITQHLHKVKGEEE